jgi:hypothetical protein
MITRYAVAALIVGLPGIGLQAVAYQAASAVTAGRPLPYSTMDPLMAALMGSAVSTLLLVIALTLYAKAKGQPMLLGFLAVFSCLGILVVALLPDKTERKS